MLDSRPNGSPRDRFFVCPTYVGKHHQASRRAAALLHVGSWCSTTSARPSVCARVKSVQAVSLVVQDLLLSRSCGCCQGLARRLRRCRKEGRVSYSFRRPQETSDDTQTLRAAREGATPTSSRSTAEARSAQEAVWRKGEVCDVETADTLRKNGCTKTTRGFLQLDICAASGNRNGPLVPQKKVPLCTCVLRLLRRAWNGRRAEAKQERTETRTGHSRLGRGACFRWSACACWKVWVCSRGVGRPKQRLSSASGLMLACRQTRWYLVYRGPSHFRARLTDSVP